MAFADRDVLVSVGHDDSGPLARFLREAVGAPIVPIEDARLVVLPEPTETQIARIPRGNEEGSRSATRVALPLSRLHRCGRAGEVLLELKGPGMGSGRRLGVDGLGRGLAEQLGRPGVSIPPGFDTWLFTPQGTITAVPGHVTVEVV
jgi:hypothetical protein